VPAAPFPTVRDLAELEQTIREHLGALVYFSTPDCGVCRTLRPKVESLVAERFPALVGRYVDCAAHPEVAARFQVFSVPVILVFFDGREWLRQGRATSVAALAAGIARPYHLALADDSPAGGQRY
jgi:thiol-disulfide isomerase/thioredoxin